MSPTALGDSRILELHPNDTCHMALLGSELTYDELLESTLTMLAQRLLTATYGTDSIIEPSLDAYYLAR